MLWVGKGYLKLIEHVIMPNEYIVKYDILNEYAYLGILAVENNEVYVIGYLKEYTDAILKYRQDS